MSLEAIKQVTQTEQDCAQRKLDAAQAAKRTVAEAEKAGQAALDARRGEAQAKVRGRCPRRNRQGLYRTEGLC